MTCCGSCPPPPAKRPERASAVCTLPLILLRRARVSGAHSYNPGDDRLQMLQRTLEFQHFAPTSPDTLGCYPFADKDQDPFVIRQCPHVYFAGNQPRFESALVEGPAGQRTRTIMVPDFLHEHTCVLVNLETLECKPMSFSGLMSGTNDAPMQL